MKPTIESLQKRVAELEQHNRIFEAIVSQSPAAIIVTDNQGKIIYSNETFQKILGYAPEELSEEFTPSIFQDIHPKNTYNEMIDTLIAGRVWIGEHQIKCKSGNVIWGRLIFFPISHQDDITNFVGIISDITLQKLAQIKRQDEEALYKSLVDNLPLEIAIYDRTGTFIFANERTDIFLNKRKGGSVGKKFNELFPAETALKQYKTLEKVFKRGVQIILERSFRVNGKMAHFKVLHQPILNEKKEFTSVLVIGENITSQVQHNQLLKIQQQIDALNNSNISLNTSLKKAFEYLLQVDWIDAGGIYLFDEDRKKLRLVYSRGLSENYIKRVNILSSADSKEVSVLKGKSRYVQTREFLKPIREVMIKEKLTLAVSIPLINKNEIIGILKLGSRNIDSLNEHEQTVIDAIALRMANLISLVKTREQLISSNLRLNKSLRALQDQQQRLVQKSRLESLGELSAGLAHEINQPLSVISLVMENIIYKTEISGAAPDYLKRKFNVINNNIEKIRNLIDHVRLFSRDQGSIMFEKVDVNKIILDSLSLVGAQFKNHNIKVKTELSENLSHTLGNPSRFEQVMLNLLANSRDALDDLDKTIMNDAREKEINIITQEEDKHIIVKMTDNGIGISKENLDNIFDPFFTTKPEGKGTGLGLAIVYGIVTEMEGTIKISSELTKFTEIIIQFPKY